MIALDGEARGTSWIDARVIGLVVPIDGSFTGLYVDWLERLARTAWPEQVARRACAHSPLRCPGTSACANSNAACPRAASPGTPCAGS